MLRHKCNCTWDEYIFCKHDIKIMQRRIAKLKGLLKECYPYLGIETDSTGNILPRSMISFHLKMKIEKALNEAEKDE